LQARPARVLGTQFQDARGERGLFAAACAKRPQVAQQGDGPVVFAGLLGRDHLVDPLPGCFPLSREFVEALGVRCCPGGGLSGLFVAPPLFLGLLPLSRAALSRRSQPGCCPA
jgi:hypothetical protein